MRLQEYLAKKCFTEFGIPIPHGKIASTPEEVHEIAQGIDGVVVLNPQISVGRYNRFGSIKLAASPDKAHQLAQLIIGRNVQGMVVHKVLVEEAVRIASEIYLDITYDRTVGAPVLTISPGAEEGLENIAHTDLDNLTREYIDPLLGLRSYQITRAVGNISLPHENWDEFHRIVQALYSCYVQYDALQVLINPLVVTREGELVALDGEIVIDDNALYRHRDLVATYNSNIGIETSVMAREANIRHVRLDGNIGCIVNGAGVAMALMDMAKLYSENEVGLANFFDIGSLAKPEKTALALRLALADSNVRVVLLNFFGNIAHCDKVAHDVVSAYAQVKSNIPLVVRIEGRNTEEGHAIIEKANNPNIIIANTLSDAAQKAVKVVAEVIT